MKLKKELLLKFMMILFVAVLAGGAMTSCSNDDEPSKSDLVGKWMYEDFDEEEIWIQFKSDGTCILGDGYGYSDTESFTWKLKGKKLIVKSEEDGTGELEITNLTEHTLSYRVYDEEFDEWDEMNFIKVEKFPWD